MNTPLPALPHGLTPWGMFLSADMVVQAVMVSLALASVVTWSIGLAKVVELRRHGRRLGRLLDVLGRSRSLAEATQAGDAAGPVAAALAEMAESAGLPPDGVRERAASRLAQLEADHGRRLAAGTGFLATIGSTAPFVGLFGTVWGIMNSFVGISKAQATSLAVVAPGIAEALLATALGLAAAIPAVVIYNLLGRAIAARRADLAKASGAILRLLGRDLDRGRASFRQAAA
ncbi:TonB-system energizer ExbB type-1 [Paramagnetospirillum caucaseum]|uniref:Biopolymer transport protein ExbB n=1 Tax=Paramagnetospirillum caucaseum TaxID=1244869 RepID=M3AER1_9PROT|nr:tonB-system energizer ExbB [Paramagnetospirillum caucaseum]EME71049.1 TonB-system energizer ExbB type-1 [Paramagnetospirillum caucaseum]